MENQENNLNWEWDNNTPQEQSIDWNNSENQNNRENNQNPQQDNKFTWEQNNQEPDPNLQWENPETTNEEINPPTLNWEDNSPIPPLDNSEINSNNDLYNLVGPTDELYYSGEIYDIRCNTEEIIKDINNLNLKIKDKDGRFDFSPQENTEIGKSIKAIVQLGMNQHNLRLIDCHIVKTNPNESFLNIFSGKPKFNFIYFIQSSENSGDIVLDFSSIGGPSFNITKPKNGSLILLPGWIPYRIFKNFSSKEQILITGFLD